MVAGRDDVVTTGVTPLGGAPGPGLVAEVVVERAGFRLDARLEVGPGEVLAMLGPNGAGKTTLLRAVAGLTRLCAGRVLVAGETWADVAAGADLPVAERRVGYVFQEYRLFPHLSVLDNVAFAARARGAGRAEARRAAGAMLDRLGLRQLAKQAPGSLSGGQGQQVALARALAAEPDVLLLDEPLAALDARTRQELRGVLRRQLVAAGVPALLVVHDPLDAMVLADHVIVIEDGRVVQRGTPREVASRPATEYVARLMGLNLYRGAVADRATGAVVLDGGGTFAGTVLGQDEDDAALAVATHRRLQDGDRVLVAVRPSAITLYRHEPDPGSARNRWNGRVVAIELLVDRARVTVDGAVSAAVDVTPSAIAELGLAEGAEVWATVKATETLVYLDA